MTCSRFTTGEFLREWYATQAMLYTYLRCVANGLGQKASVACATRRDPFYSLRVAAAVQSFKEHLLEQRQRIQMISKVSFPDILSSPVQHSVHEFIKAEVLKVFAATERAMGLLFSLGLVADADPWSNNCRNCERLIVEIRLRNSSPLKH